MYSAALLRVIRFAFSGKTMDKDELRTKFCMHRVERDETCKRNCQCSVELASGLELSAELTAICMYIYINNPIEVLRLRRPAKHENHLKMRTKCISNFNARTIYVYEYE